MWTVLKKSRKNKTRLLCLALLLALPFTATAEEQDKAPYYWVKIADKNNSLAAVQELMADLPDEIRKDELRICMDGNEYVLVHTGAADPDAAFLIKEQLNA